MLNSISCQLDNLISFSLLYPSQTNDLHISIIVDLYQSFLWLHRRLGLVGGPICQGIPPINFFTPYEFTHLLIRTHVKVFGLCFKMSWMGSSQADVKSTKLLKHIVVAQVANHNHNDNKKKYWKFWEGF